MSPYERVVVETDGGARGNPDGPAGYGALVRDPESGRVLAQRAEAIGVTSNNVAEYRGLIAGLELAAEVAPGAAIEVRADSKLVIEQMAGRWKIKHPDMRTLALQARELATTVTDWTWVPRAQNAAADALANAAMDGKSVPRVPDGEVAAPSPDEGAAADSNDATDGASPFGDSAQAWSERFRNVGRGAAGGVSLTSATTLLLVRHATTELTVGRRFSGRGGSDPELDASGRTQAAALATGLATRWEFGEYGSEAEPPVVVCSPMRRARETAEVIARALGGTATPVEGWEETAFGEWDGLGVDEVQQRWPEELAAYLSDPGAAPPGGESLLDVGARVRKSRDRVLARHPGRTVVVVTHLTPINMLVGDLLDVGPGAFYRMSPPPASVTEISFGKDPRAMLLRTFGDRLAP